MSTPQQFLDTCFVHDLRRRIISTREPEPTPGPLFCILRGAESCAWSVHANLPDNIADDVVRIARHEPPNTDFRAGLIYAAALRDRLSAYIKSRDGATSDVVESSGPALAFPIHLADATDVRIIDDEQSLAPEFRGWVHGEIARGRSPVLAAFDDGRPVSICFCARSSPVAAEAGVETVERFRGRGLAARVVAAWAHAIRAQGRIPQYSTFWTNAASLSVARKLALIPYASFFNFYVRAEVTQP